MLIIFTIILIISKFRSGQNGEIQIAEQCTMIPFVIQSSGIKSKDLIVSRWPDIELFMYYYTNYSTIMHIILAIILIILQV
jgi:hypothetical protein